MSSGPPSPNSFARLRLQRAAILQRCSNTVSKITVARAE
jgi:hypothetical protein